MQIEIDPLSEIPLYLQLRDRVVEAIATGQLLPGDRLASVRQVAVAFGINVATVDKGYDLLRREKLIRTNQKSGSIVARGPRSGAASAEFLSEWTPRLRILLAEAWAQGADSAQILQFAHGTLDEFDTAGTAGAAGAAGTLPDQHGNHGNHGNHQHHVDQHHEEGENR